MSGLPFRSKLAPFEQEIIELRRQRPPVSYRQIVQLLKEQHGIEVTINGVFAFLRTRRKWDRRAAAERNRQFHRRSLKFPALDGRLHLLWLRIAPAPATKQPLVASSSTIPTATPTT